MVRKDTGVRLFSGISALIAVFVFGIGGFTAKVSAQVSSDEYSPKPVLTVEHPQVRNVMDIQNRHTDALMNIPGVSGTGTGVDENNEPVLVVLVSDPRAALQLPPELEGVPVSVRPMGEITLTDNTGTNTTTTTSRFTRPVPIGISTSNWNDCSAGTIGVRVRNGNNYYVLSCNHVFARMNAASYGERIVQPGRGDVSCAQYAADEIGQLADFESIQYSYYASNLMDAAIVSTTPSLVDISTPIDGYGTPSSTTKTAALNMVVQKYGRTTGLTRGEVTIINAAVVVPYGVAAARFVGQIIVQPLKRNQTFADGGDSGSLAVTDDANANPVGMVFGKSNDMVFLNPIDVILTRFNVQIDDGTPNPLPVELVFFSGNMIGDDVQLKWRTVTELENYGFYVQRSTDNEHWTDIDMIPGAGTTNTPQNYSYVDADVVRHSTGSKLYYRLLQVDRDGTENYSSVLEIEPRPFTVTMEVFPHPVRSDATVQLQLNQPMDGQLYVFDALGRKLDVYDHTLPMIQGTQNVSLSFASMPAGNYFLVFESAGTVVRKRIMVVR